MAEQTLDLRGERKPEAWPVLEAQLASVLSTLDDPIAAMATISCLVHHAFGHLWTGFYRVVAPGLLRVGPYQGTLGCLEIPFGKGVCGTSAADERTVVVDDVHAIANHITCDARSKSEVVLPVFNRDGVLVAVFDIDSDRLAAFDDVDVEALTRVLAWFKQPSVRW
jgi:L-methionine (R)-S-oxide reductase